MYHAILCDTRGWAQSIMCASLPTEMHPKIFKFLKITKKEKEEEVASSQLSLTIDWLYILIVFPAIWS